MPRRAAQDDLEEAANLDRRASELRERAGKAEVMHLMNSTPWVIQKLLDYLTSLGLREGGPPRDPKPSAASAHAGSTVLPSRCRAAGLRRSEAKKNGA